LYRDGGPLARIAPILAIAVLALAAGQAGATPPADASPVRERSQMEPWKGRHCTPTRCAGSQASPWSAAIGFGAAIITTRWVARRRR
jgi:hypothetical protein